MSTPSWPPKDPDEVLDYQIDWTARLDGDTIDTSDWIMPNSITKDSATFSDTASTIWISGGLLGSSVVLTNRITTAGGRTMDQSVKLQIKSK